MIPDLLLDSRDEARAVFSRRTGRTRQQKRTPERHAGSGCPHLEPGCAGCLNHGRFEVPGTCSGGLPGEGTGVGNLRISGVSLGSRGRMLSGHGLGWESLSRSYPLLPSGPSRSGSPDGRPNPPRSSPLAQRIGIPPATSGPSGASCRQSPASDGTCTPAHPNANTATAGHFRTIVWVFNATPCDPDWWAVRTYDSQPPGLPMDQPRLLRCRTRTGADGPLPGMASI